MVADRFRNEGDLTGTCFVFPSRRAALFFHKALTVDGAHRTIHAVAIDQVMQSIADLQPASRIKALTVLHACWNDLSKTPASIESFFEWGDALLSDLEELYCADVDLADAEDTLEGYLAKTARVAGTKDTTALLEKMRTLQHTFFKALSDQQLATPGQMQRLAAMKARETHYRPLARYERIVFVGAGRLTACQKAVLARLHGDGRALFFWDYAGRAVTDTKGGGAFMAENIAAFPQAEGFTPEAFDPADQRWSVVHVPSASGQGDCVAEGISESLGRGVSEEDIAVVVADSSLLGPVLDSIPVEVEHINVTMGQMVIAGGSSALVDTAEELLRTVRRKDGVPQLYYKPVLAMLRHAAVRSATEGARTAERTIMDCGAPYVTAEAVCGDDAILRRLFIPATKEDVDVPAWLADMLVALQATASPMEREAMTAYHAAIMELKDAVRAPMKAASWLRIIRRAAASTTIPFEGEPLQGLQVLGPLETRCLDFEAMIFVGASEGVFPAPGGRPSMLPQTLREVLGLSSPADREAMTEYNFWRSTCRAKDITLVHDCRTDGLRKGEETRFAKQLRYLYGVTPAEVTVPTAIDPSAMMQTTMRKEKDESVMKALREKFIEGNGVFSASSLNTYLDCPMRYWWECVTGITEEDGVVENPDAALLGTIFHAVMENLYKPHVGETLPADRILGLARGETLAALAEAAFVENGIADLSGRNGILRDLVVRLAAKTLEADAAVAPLTILGTEKSVTRRITLPGSGLTVRLYGKIDRLDRTGDGTRRVVDYKSGSVKGHDDIREPLRALDRAAGKKRPYIGLQLLLYALLSEDSDGLASPCIYSTKEIFGAQPKAAAVGPEAAAAFGDALAATIDEIFNPDVPFTTTEDTDNCTFCPFKNICNRI